MYFLALLQLVDVNAVHNPEASWRKALRPRGKAGK